MSTISTTREHVILARGCNRRSFLLTVLAGAIAAGFPTGPGMANAAAGGWPAWLSEITGEHDAVVRLGKAYLAAHPGEQDAGFLIVAIERAATSRLGSDTAAGADPERVVAALRQVVRGEYIRGDVVLVNRWILSTTEARLYGLVAALAD